MKYFDNCATSPLDPVVSDVMNKYQSEFYNPSSLYEASAKIKRQIEHARESIANALGAQSGELIFTSGGTESNNLALFGTMRNQKGKIISAMTEHNSVFSPLLELKNRGFEIIYAPLNSDGSVKTEGFADLIDEDTKLVAIMHVNNETGAINDIKTLCKTAKQKNPSCLFFSDGVQAFCKIPVNVKDLGVDLYSFCAHKIHGPKGIGALYIKKGVSLRPIIFGGGQENNLRSGTENFAGIMAFEAACQIARSVEKSNFEKFLQFKGILNNIITDKIDNFMLLQGQNAAPNILTFAFKNIKSEVLMHMLEQNGFFVGNGSACSSRQRSSRLAQAIGLPADYAEGIVRICFCKFNDENEVREFGESLCDAIDKLRKIMGATSRR